MPEILFAVVFLGVFTFFIVRFVKYGGFRGALYGSRVLQTFGDLELARFGGARTILRVHVLEDGRIVLEQSSRATLAASVSGIPMGPFDVDQLIHFLQQARATPTP